MGISLRGGAAVPEVSFSSLAVVASVAFAVPLFLGAARSFRMPEVALEILLGIVIGPSVLGWVKVDVPVQVLALVGVAFILLLAGLEMDLDHLKGRFLKVALGNALVSFALALLCTYGLRAASLVGAPLLIAIILSATSLGIIVPILKDAGQSTSAFGQLVIAGASIADFGTIILLSLFFSREATATGAKLVLIGTFVLLAAAAGFAIGRAERSTRFSALLQRLQDTTAQIRVRGAFLLLIAFVAMARKLGLEVVFGAFTAGAILKLVDRDEMLTHPNFRLKLEAAGFGFFIPVFFVASGITFNLPALFASASTIALVPIFLAALLLVRGLPALLYRPIIGGRRAVAAALLQATSLPFIVVASQIGLDLGLLRQATGAAMVTAGLFSVLAFPLGALTLLRGEGTPAPVHAASPLTGPET
jgi:Kef-type K+ transport system membrane component KefB